MNKSNERKQESLVERLEIIINYVDVKRFQDVRKYMKKNIPSAPSRSETKRILGEIFDETLSDEEKDLMKCCYEDKYDLDLPKLINNHQSMVCYRV